MPTMASFTPLGRVFSYTDYLIVGIETSRKSDKFGVDMIFETIDRFCIHHLKPVDGKLKEVEVLTEFEGCQILEYLLRYYDMSNRALIVVNNSLVMLGSSDLTALLDAKVLEISSKDVDASSVMTDQKGRVSDVLFMASAPPTIVGLLNPVRNQQLTIVDFANYGIKDIGDMALQLDYSWAKAIPNYAEIGISHDKCDTVTMCMSVMFRKFYDLTIKHKLGPVACTYSGQAMRSFRRNHFDGTIIKHGDETAATIEESCYFGGRCEARWHGKYTGNCYLLDINSLYPSIGRDSVLPRELISSHKAPSHGDISGWLDSSSIFAHVRITTNEPLYPARYKGRVIYPTGTFNTYICGHEYAEAFKRGDIVKTYFCCRYAVGNIVKDFSSHMLKVRSIYKSNRDRVSEHYVKMITNGLWGQLARIGNRWIIDERVHPSQRYGGFIYINEDYKMPDHYRVIDGVASKLCRSYHIDNTFLPIPAAINAICRQTLWRYMQFAGMSNVLYCAIDGLIVTEEGYRNLKPFISDSPYAYGMFKVSEQAKECFIQGHGIYRIGNKIAYTGVPLKNSYQYKGFWNCRDERYMIDDITGESRTQIVTLGPSADLRGNLGKHATQDGGFTCPTTLLDDPIDYEIDYCRQHQPSFAWDDYLR